MKVTWFAGIALLAAAVVTTAARGETFTAGIDELRDPAFWKTVAESLEREPADVAIRDGAYVAVPAVSIVGAGHARNTLTIRAASAGKVSFADAPADNPAAAARNVLVELRDCQNVTLREFTFTTPQPIASALAVQGCRNVRVEHCRFVDLPQAYYSAMSVTGEKTDGVVVRGCEFRRVGLDAHAHMIYGAYGVQRLGVVECAFEDCSGEFVRFRDESDRGVVFGCTFKSTGTYRNANPAMISVPLFNDDDPASHPATPNYEYFGTHFIFANNRFEYAADKGRQDTRFAVSFSHSGFDPPGRRHLLTAAEGKTLKDGTPDERRGLLKANCGIELENVHVFGNVFEHVDRRLVFQSHPAYGAKSRGFAGVIDLSDLANATPVVQTADQAMAYLAK
jgi:hypothetical protein